MTILRGKKCIGFGEFDRRCENMAGPNPYWCPRCDALRLQHLDKRFEEITARLANQDFEWKQQEC